MGLRKKLRALFSKKKIWPELEFFDPRWKRRIEMMAQHIDPADSVLDLGCGQMWLKEFLSPENPYTPCDYTSRGPDTIVCDFNQHQFPDVSADVSFVSGCLEYVDDVDWFLDRIAGQTSRCVMSYCIASPEKSIAERRELAWRNHFSEDELLALFERHGMTCQSRGEKFMSSHIYSFARRDPED